MEPMGPDDRNHEQALAVRRPVCDLSLRLFLGGIHACHERCSEYDSIWLRRQYALAKVSDNSSRPSRCSCSGIRHMSMEDYVLCKHIPYIPFRLWDLMAPVCAIMVCEYFMISRGNIFVPSLYNGTKSNENYWYTGGWNLRAYIAYVVAIALPFPGK